MTPSFVTAVRLSFRALVRSKWLMALGLGVALLSRVLSYPAWVFALFLLARDLFHSARLQSFLGPSHGAFTSVLGSREFLIFLGLWGCSLTARGLLRVSWIAGVLPELGGGTAGSGGRFFAAGVAYGFPRVLGTAGLALVSEVSGAAFSVILLLAVAMSNGGTNGPFATASLAFAGAGALVLALIVPLCLSVLGDAAVARAALRGETPARAYAGALRRFLSRPGTFILVAIVFAFASTFLTASVSGLSAAATGFAPFAAPLVRAGPSLMLSVAATFVASTLDLGWLGTVAALACARERA